MKLTPVLLAVATATAPMIALAEDSPAVDEPTLVERYEQLLEAARSPDQDFFAAYDAARDAGMGENQLVEARVIKALNAGDIRSLVSMIDKLERHRTRFDIGFDPTGTKSHVFSSQDDVDGLISALKAVRAYQSDDAAAFEQYAKDAYWLWPRWAAAFQLERLIAERRFKKIAADHVARLTLSLDLPLRDLDDQPTTLGELLKGRKAVLLDFWASWCGPCLRSMPDLQERARNLPPQDVAVVAVNTDDEDPLVKARQIKDEKKMDMPWLVEATDQPLSKALLIDSIPRAVLVGPTGRVLFSGHPADTGLSERLKELGVDEHQRPPPRVDVSPMVDPEKISLPDLTTP